MPIEKELFITRDILKIFQRFKYPTHIITKSDLVLRDIDILKKINEVAILPDDLKNHLNSKVIITFSFSTTNNKIAKIVEPNAPSPKNRLKAIKSLSKLGFKVGIGFIPVLPFISDTEDEIKKSMELFSNNNCQYILSGSLSLFGNESYSSRIKYYNFIRENFPELLKKTEALFKNKEYPSQKYQELTYKKIAKFSKEFGIKNSII